MTVSFRSNEAAEWRHALGTTIARVADDEEFVVVDRGLRPSMAVHGEWVPVYSLATRAAPHVTWVLDADDVDQRYRLVEDPFYTVGRLNPSTWTVAYPAPGNSALRHVFAQCDSLIAAERTAVTANLTRRRTTPTR